MFDRQVWKSVRAPTDPYPVNTKHLYNIYIQRLPNALVQHCIDVIQMFCVYWGERGAMVRVRSSVEVTACREVSNLAWCMIFREISCFSPLNLVILFRCCVLGQGTPSHALLDPCSLIMSRAYLVKQWPSGKNVKVRLNRYLIRLETFTCIVFFDWVEHVGL